MQPTFDQYFEGYGAELLCPSCGNNYLHHDRVEVFERSEDETQGLHVSVSEGKATLDNALSGNPSARRHGLSIHFWCEGCSTRSVLNIAQHKGNTFIDLVARE